MQKLVSVIIPAYNQSQYIGFAIESVLNQTYPAWECIIIDDGSTDLTASVVHQYRHSQIKYIFQDNSGLSAARNTGIRASKGEYLSFLDSDDGFAPQKLELLMQCFVEDLQLGLAAGNAGLIDEFGQPIDRNFNSQLPGDLSDLLLGNPLHVGSVLIKREWQEKIGFFDETLRSYEDWDFWLRLALAGVKMRSINNVVSFYRFHTAQMTRNPQQMTEASFSVLEKLFSQTQLPQEWKDRRDLAFSQSHLRAAANAYAVGDFLDGRRHLDLAVTLNPNLIENNCQNIIDQMLAWTELPKLQKPLNFLENVFDQLPRSLDEIISPRKNRILTTFAINLGFKSFANHDYENVRNYFFFAIKNDFRWIFNPGVVSAFVKSIIKINKPTNTVITAVSKK